MITNFEVLRAVISHCYRQIDNAGGEVKEQYFLRATKYFESYKTYLENNYLDQRIFAQKLAELMALHTARYPAEQDILKQRLAVERQLRVLQKELREALAAYNFRLANRIREKIQQTKNILKSIAENE
jgi:hypothetical protein